MNDAAMEWAPRSTVFARSLPRRITAAITAFAFLVQAVSPGFAQTVTPDAAAGANRPAVGAARNGVPIVNIVRPNSSGLSHNKYTDFNVGTRGLILNNSDAAGRSVLGGMILANPNLVGRAQARVILNEVTSSNRSLLQGYQEVFGGRADLILANPNGITCDGCGFINTPRATLTTGTPVLDPTTRALMGFDVNRGVIDVAALGLDASTVDYFDIVSRSVQINGAIHGRDLGIFAGRNAFDYLARTATAHATDASGKPEFGIDSSMLGGMYAGKIKLVGTEKGVGVRAPSKMSASAGGMTITADGRLVMRGRASAKTRVVARSTASRIDVEGTIHAEDGVDLQARDAVSIAADSSVSSLGSVRITSLDSSISAGSSAALLAGFNATTGTLNSPAALELSAGTAIMAGQTLLASGGSVELSARQIDLRRAIASAEPNVLSLQDLSLNAETILAANARLESAGPVTLASAGQLTVSDGFFLTPEALTLEAAGALNSSAMVNT